YESLALTVELRPRGAAPTITTGRRPVRQPATGVTPGHATDRPPTRTTERSGSQRPTACTATSSAGCEPRGLAPGHVSRPSTRRPPTARPSRRPRPSHRGAH